MAEIDPKLLKAVVKEGGKKGVEIEGAADMGGLEFFCTASETADGRTDLLKIVMENMNAVPDPTAEERRGGSAHVGKMLLSAGVNALAIVAYVPEDKQEKVSAIDWIKAVIADKGVNPDEAKVEDGATAGLAFATAPLNKEKEIFPLKMKDAAQAASIAWLREKGVFPEARDDSSSDFILGDDDLGDM
eukprot:TRINITY_DN20015_c0_g1_i1.p1 TRINITY_DN20015_c0_g1~~TRINITY_DN20015_c0_g1_i1.p1  ORF type:complete len:188 (+),score=89.40 TRINITY_DN20015_c0_g1_i1:36-599(+)